MAGYEYGDLSNWTVSYNKTDSCFKMYFEPYLKVVKKTNKNRKYYSLNGTDLSSTYGNLTHYYLYNGVELTFYGKSKYPNHIFILVDLNGEKEPNKLGRDLFYYQFSASQGLIPNGASSKSRTYLLQNGTGACNKANNGLYCLGLIVFDGWQISKDYPW